METSEIELYMYGQLIFTKAAQFYLVQAWTEYRVVWSRNFPGPNGKQMTQQIGIILDWLNKGTTQKMTEVTLCQFQALKLGKAC